MRAKLWPLAALTLLGLDPALAQPARIDRPGDAPVIIEQPGAPEAERRGGDIRECRADRLIVDYVGADREQVDVEAIVGRITGRLRAMPGLCQGWFGREDGQCRIAVDRIVDQEIANRARVPQLSKLHVELTFRDVQERMLSLNPSAACDAVASVRYLLDEAYGERARRDFYVSRACDASVLGDWAADGVRAAAPPLIARRRGGLVAIVDGPHTRQGDQVVQPRAGIGDAPVPTGSVDYAHADAVGLLVRRASPRAEIRFYTALDPQAMGSPIGRVANGIARAAADAAGAPLVVNLSLGWPHEMQSTVPISGPSPRILGELSRRRADACNADESPSGEVVRAWIEALADRDIIFVAAAGNRRAAPAPGAPLGTPTKPAPMFYPAAWTRAFPHLIAVGAYGRRPVPELGVGAGRNGRPDLYAPGLRVPTLRPAALSQVVPVLLTGTSGATALVSGALANSPMPDRLAWLNGRLSRCPVQALPGTRAMFLGPCPAGELVAARSKPTLRPERLRAPRRPLVTPRPTLTPRGVMPRPGNGARIALDRYSAGSVGPQPEDDGCLVPCRFLLDVAARKGDLRATIDLGELAIVKNPRLVFRSGAEKDSVFLPASGVPTTPVKSLELTTDDIALPQPIKVDKTLEVSLEFELQPSNSGKAVRREITLQILTQ